MYSIDNAIDSVVDQQRHDVEAGRVPVANWYQFTQNALRQYCFLLSSLASSSYYATGLPILEIGTEYGLSTLALAYGLQNKRDAVHTWEINTDRWASTCKRFSLLGASHVIYARSALFTPDSVVAGGYSMAYVDGNHSYLGCLKDLNMLCNAICQRGIILCHDSLWEDHPDWKPERNGVRQAVCQFLANCPEWRAMQLDGFALLQREQPWSSPSLHDHPEGVSNPGPYKFTPGDLRRSLVRPGASAGEIITPFRG